ncbi:hypothetical protein COV17_03120 [Candidatus Woesearchaeota archaeon CG10_big_fil_rev_8_21_14_0_10_36_11]|nr:MAG: hypothetical protein COV17_03120 [Candidatus Woesearchaeota archaeon CG10_big_fil_rev_8_21_14_0_10_36_11]
MNNNKTFLIIFCIFLPIFITLFSFKTTLFFIDGTPQQENTIDFLTDNTELTQEYTDNELIHLRDVQRVMNYSTIWVYFSVLILTGIITLYRKETKQIQKLLKYGGITTLAYIGTVSLVSILSFDTIFTLFHKIFFPQGNWQFPLDSILISTFPYNFFIFITIKIGIQALCWGILFIFLSFYINYGTQSTKH